MSFTTGWLLASLLVSSFGLGFAVYGKKQLRLPQFLAGVLLLVDSTFVPSWRWMLGAAGLVLAILWGALRNGL